jgi:hypothetical protein
MNVNEILSYYINPNEAAQFVLSQKGGNLGLPSISTMQTRTRKRAGHGLPTCDGGFQVIPEVIELVLVRVQNLTGSERLPQISQTRKTSTLRLLEKAVYV